MRMCLDYGRMQPSALITRCYLTLAIVSQLTPDMPRVAVEAEIPRVAVEAYLPRVTHGQLVSMSST